MTAVLASAPLPATPGQALVVLLVIVALSVVAALPGRFIRRRQGRADLPVPAGPSAEGRYRAPVMSTGHVGRRVRARYAFAGVDAELARAAPLAPDEPVLLHGQMNLRGQGLLNRPTVVWVTPQRLILLAHYALQPDRLWEIPRGAVQQVQVVQRTVRVSWASADAGVAESRLAAWSNRRAVVINRPLRDANAVAELLQSWLYAPDGNLPVRAAPSHRRW